MVDEGPTVTWDGNEATAHVAYRTHEVVAIYPITPASPMGEHADTWASQGRPNLWGEVPRVIEMQSEGGAAGTVHGALQAGALTTTFTASQGLLLMLPNMFKIAGELTSAVIHVAARSVACQALSIFGDHSDVYAARGTGFAMLASGSVQEAHDFALISHAATLSSRIPFLHFFDGFRTSHEVARTVLLSDPQIRAMIDDDAVQAHRARALSPDRPFIRGTAQNPDVFFQAREAVNPFYDACPAVVEQMMGRFGELTGRSYALFDYVGHPEADRVIVLMGSGAEAVHETVDWLVDHRAERVGVLKVRLYRPFSIDHLIRALPTTVKSVAVLDRTKEPGAPGEPLYLDVVTGLHEAVADGRLARMPRVVGGRYGLSSKEFTPAMVVGVFDNLSAERPRNHFTVGIYDDVSNTSLPWDPDLDIEPDDVVRAVFYGLGADGTVGANKNTIKIIGEHTGDWAQGYFVYDSKKSGAVTVSHLRFGPRPIRSSYLVRRAGFVACHQWSFLDRLDVLKSAARGATVLLNAPYPADQVWDRLPRDVQAQVVDKGLKLHVIDAYRVARAAGMAGRINTVMQTCFFAISGVLPRDEAIGHIKDAIEKTYGRKGAEIVRMNFAVVDAALDNLHEIEVPREVTSSIPRSPAVAATAPAFVQRVTARIMAGEGDQLPVSCFPPDGTWPASTTRWEKRTIAERVPQWDAELCIQCNKCAMVCPHAAIRIKTYPPEALAGAPDGFRSMEMRAREFPGERYTVQVAPEDCTGCTLCAVVCPAKDRSNPRHKSLDMVPIGDVLEREVQSWQFFSELPEADRTRVKRNAKDAQLLQPLFEFSGACAGCGETPYLKLLTQLFGDRLLIANATGCSSIYGGNLPATPWATNPDGRGPAWSNSLFEDNAEFGLGFRLAVDTLTHRARALVERLSDSRLAELAEPILNANARTEADIAAQRERVAALRTRLAEDDSTEARELRDIADYLVPKSVWIVGGDGWAYDIGYGGLDHVLASGLDVNVLVLDTQVYSNTGGQQSKATPLGAVAKFASAGKDIDRKDLGALAMAYGNVYVAQIALGAKDTQTAQALLEAESWPGPSIVIAYSPCIAHGYDLARSLDQADKAVKSGFWPLFRYDPRGPGQGRPALRLDAKPPSVKVSDFAYTEARFRMLATRDPARARELMTRAQHAAEQRYARLAALQSPPTEEGT